MGFSRAECERLGIGDLFPAPAWRKGAGRVAHERFAMNRTEDRYAQALEADRLEGKIRGWEFETVTLVLTSEMTFTPDFVVEQLDGLFTMVDVKGKHTFEDSTVKGKAAAALFPYHTFVQARWIPDRVQRRRTGPNTYRQAVEPGHWVHRKFSP